jgi:fatty-acid peroxygenase
MLTGAICLRGTEAARLFYGSDRFTRVGAMPLSVLHLLQDGGSVQLLDGTLHHHRKCLFLDIFEPDPIDRLREAFRAEFRAALPRWRNSRALHCIRNSMAFSPALPCLSPASRPATASRSAACASSGP